MTGSLITTLAVLLLVAVGAGVYLLPTLIGCARHVPHLGSVAVVNILLGWTLAGWVVALAMAMRSALHDGPVIQLVQNGPPASPPVPQGPMPGWQGPAPGVAAPPPVMRPFAPPGGPAHPGNPNVPARHAEQAPPLIVPPRRTPAPGSAVGPDGYVRPDGPAGSVERW